MKITLLKTKNIDDTLLQQGILLVQNAFKSINFPLEITQQVSTKIYTTEMFSNTTIGQGACVVPSQILDEVDGTADIAFLIFSNVGMFPKPLNPLQTPIKKGKTTPCQMCQEWCGTPMQPAVFAEFFVHECVHALFYLTNNVANDTTHAYIPAYSQKPRIDYYLYLIDSLRPAFNALLGGSVTPQKPPDAVLIRNIDNGVETLGTLTTSDNQFQCRTLERAWKNNQKNISCIPTGTYQVVWTHTWRFPLGVYQIQNVPNRSGIDIHAANFFFNLLGCIALGSLPQDINHDNILDLINSRSILNSFELKMNKKDFILEIK